MKDTWAWYWKRKVKYLRGKDWNEDDHPRDDSGRFGSGGGESEEFVAEEAHKLDNAMIASVKEILSKLPTAGGKEMLDDVVSEKMKLADLYLPIRAEIKSEICRNVAKELVGGGGLGFDRAFRDTGKQLRLWSETSGDHSPMAIKMQYAVDREFGLKDAAKGHFDSTSATSLPVEKEDLAYVRAEYNNTQKWFKDHGITHISVYRGQAVEGKVEYGGHSEVNMQPASSWTTSRATANSFSIRDGEANPVVFSARIPVERVLSTSLTGRGCITEQEIIILGGKLHVKMNRKGKS